MKRGYSYYQGRWVPRSHFYDYGEEPIYMGPPRRDRAGRRRGRPMGLVGFAVCCPVVWFVINTLLGH
jgi:hypothetical protein